MIGQNFKHTAVFDGKHFDHFGIHPITAILYGHESSEIIDVNVCISDDQKIPANNDGNMDVDYWGWYCFEKKTFTMVYGKRFLLNMCFPSGIESAENAKQGKAYRLKVTKL